jgi:hypothetical protein
VGSQFWKFYKIKVVIARESEKEIWKIILLSILPTGNESIRYNILLEDSAINMIEETRSSDSFEQPTILLEVNVFPDELLLLSYSE